MSSIAAIIDTAPVIACQGTETTYVQYTIRPFGQRFLLVATMVSYLPVSQQEVRYEIGREIADEEDSVNVACDLEWQAADELDAAGDRGWKDGGLGFAEAVERWLDARHVLAAE